MTSFVENSEPGSEPGTPEVQPNKRRGRKSIVWEHFTVQDVGGGSTRACCKQCQQTFAYSSGTKLSGTSHLKRHIDNGICLATRRKEKNQLKSSAPRGDGTGTSMDVPAPKRQCNGSSYSVNPPFDQERCRHELAKMIIMHEYPLHMVEHPAFISFVKKLQPLFNMVDLNTVQGDCMAIYQKEKQEILKLLSETPGRINLSVDLWTSSETLGFVFLRAHFINSAWKLDSRILSVVMSPFPHSKDALSQAVEICVGNWGLENKVLSLTLNKSIFRSDTESLRGFISMKNPLLLNGQLLVGHCYVQVLSNIVQDALVGMQEAINKVRESIKYVKTSRAHEVKFLQLKEKLQVPSAKCLSLDDQTQWNTTYLMLVAAVELKEVFCCLDTADPDYQLTLSMDDWKQIETLCIYLKIFYDAAHVVSSTTHPTADLFFHEAWKIQLEFICGTSSQDPLIINLVNLLREKFDRYWKDCCFVLAIAVVLDPQFKMKLVECSFSRILGDEADTYIKIVDESIHELFSEYIMQFPLSSYLEQGSLSIVKAEESLSIVKAEESLSIVKAEESLSIGKTEEAFDVSSGGNLPVDDFFDSDVFMSELSGSQSTKSELDQYLEEPVVPFTLEFEILSWWAHNSFKYPTLSKMARDILSIPLSAVNPETVFSIGSRKFDQYWSSLQPETMEALVCAKDWLRYGSTNTM
ncbi:Zinc finger bed domain-containing protein ricesleeper [Thalictrum thalictroides]|uniref:Zinc finger bed domain-containing protein ricesleeper n=1 Tax=Thalictrum thalictroides TaxID=46969 RepID=A0A7J6X310_THATH|nr:Zinc finger bed domain-containing protein ricesleeper [Thalictrum thalictroides]